MPSSVISFIKYDKANAALRITFVSGIIYTYKNVPEEVHEALLSSSSKGTYLNQHIKGKYEFEKVT
ncbi:MAG: KTSC domain-containing protein [Bacteroidota bacterium]|nr:KTSC domain-containing protein [Bacteroidota bacterium]MDQ6888836.1 KTSC domain-containing protein [Bacteroidota bacterium]